MFAGKEKMMKRIVYQEDELTVVGTHYGYSFGTPVPAYKTPVTAKENFYAMVNHETPCWIPTYDDFCVINPRSVPDNIVHHAVRAVNPLTEDEIVPQKDMFGIEWEYVPVAGGVTVKPGNPRLSDANEWKEKIPFPDVSSWNWKEDAKLNQSYLDNDQPKMTWMFSGFFERLISFMDFEPAILALIDEEQMDAVKELFDALCGLYEEMLTNLKKYYDIDVVYFHDDWGSQRAPFFSVNTCREMLMPYIKRLCGHCHKLGVLFEMHCCGNVEMLIPVMIEAGVDLWGGQPTANNFDMLRDQYGNQITIGIAAPIAPDADDETAYQTAKAYVDKYIPDYTSKPVYITGFLPHIKQREYLYVLSRKGFGE